jgi:hypothetical protein
MRSIFHAPAGGLRSTGTDLRGAHYRRSTWRRVPRSPRPTATAAIQRLPFAGSNVASPTLTRSSSDSSTSNVCAFRPASSPPGLVNQPRPSVTANGRSGRPEAACALPRPSGRRCGLPRPHGGTSPRTNGPTPCLSRLRALVERNIRRAGAARRAAASPPARWCWDRRDAVSGARGPAEGWRFCGTVSTRARGLPGRRRD